MAQDETVTDGIIITNNVEVTAQSGLSQTPQLNNAYLSRSASMRSHNISISSISDLESDSSIQTTSVDYLAEMQRPDITEIVEKQTAVATNHQSSDFIPTQIASIAIKDSTDITFGNKTHYHGPVTIKQFMLDRDKGGWASTSNGGVTNGGYANSSLSLDNAKGKNHILSRAPNCINTM